MPNHTSPNPLLRQYARQRDTAGVFDTLVLMFETSLFQFFPPTGVDNSQNTHTHRHGRHTAINKKKQCKISNSTSCVRHDRKTFHMSTSPLLLFCSRFSVLHCFDWYGTVSRLIIPPLPHSWLVLLAWFAACAEHFFYCFRVFFSGPF